MLELLLTLHILSAIWLMTNLIGAACWKKRADWFGTPEQMATTAQALVRSDLIFTAPTIIRQKLPKERIREASWQLQAPGSYDHLTIPHHPTTETLLHRLLSQEGELKPGKGWMPESRARCVAPDIFRGTREAALKFKPGEHLLDEMDREMAYLSGQALEMLEETREPSGPDSSPGVQAAG